MQLLDLALQPDTEVSLVEFAVNHWSYCVKHAGGDSVRVFGLD